MTRSGPGRLQRLVRVYSVAVGFALSQLSMTPPSNPRETHAIVRTHRADGFDRRFDPRERARHGLVMTLPYPDRSALDLNDPDGKTDEAWVRAN